MKLANIAIEAFDPNKPRYKINRDKVQKDGAIIRDMNDETYKLRREVIDFIYELKNVAPDLPRIQVRIVDMIPQVKKEQGVLGFAYLKLDTIFIDNDFIKETNNSLELVVAHEILHGSLGIRHVSDKQDIMYYKSQRNKSKDWIISEFKKWYDRFKAGKIKANGYLDDKNKLIKWAEQV